MFAKIDCPDITIPHSCFPNCAVNDKNEIVLFRPVLQGDKLTIDYSTLFEGEEILENCTCGFNGCRKIVLGFRYLPVVYQEFYLENNAVSLNVLQKLRKNLHFTGS